MNEIFEFFKLKETLDKSAREQGRSNALPRELLPHLAKSLEEFSSSQNSIYKGTREQLYYLLNAARIMAIFAVWDNDFEWIKFAFLCLLIEGGQSDSRITMTYLALINHSSQKIGQELILHSGDLMIQSPVASWIESFVNNPGSDKCIELYGYQEASKSGRFDFKCII